ncbi:recombinase zinc beta ribbon domain-containing protein, partial [Streptomyces halstedii]|uniref:recombinase zinc beta ribbon domain-containing protein n=1 Tax=Streptomyces halstedii TaxID=1944 RepID=UPI00343A54D2
KILNSKSIPVFRSGARNASAAWGTSSVSKIINNRALLGEYQPTHVLNGVRVPEGEPVLNFYPAVLTEETFYLAHSARSLRRTSGASKQSKRFNVWQGIAKCNGCGDAMHLVNKGKPPKGYTYLQCYSSRKGVCSSAMLRLDRTELAFREILAKVDSLSLVQDSSNAIQKSISVIEAQLAALTVKLTKAVEVHSEVPTIAGARLLSDLEQQQEELKSEQEKLKQKLQIERITNKEDFFKKLDLTSYDGRSAANSLMKRLGLFVHIERRVHQNNSFYFYVSPAAKLPEINSLLFAVRVDANDEVAVQALDYGIAAIQIVQGEVTESAIAWEDEDGDGISADWFGGGFGGRRKVTDKGLH